MSQLAFPYRPDARGRTASADPDVHIRELIEQLLFTTPGERVNRPTFGTGIKQLVFAPNSPELAGATQMLIQGALQQWLGELIQVDGVEVNAAGETLWIQVRYTVRRTQDRRLAEFQRGVA